MGRFADYSLWILKKKNIKSIRIKKEENIENGFACSMKQRAKKTEVLAQGLEIEVENRKVVIYELTTKNIVLKDKIREKDY